MTTLAAPDTDTLRRFGRAQLFALVIAVLAPNAVAAKVLQSFWETGVGPTIGSGLGVSWTFWLAAAACLRLAWTEAPAPIRAFDVWLAAGCVVAALVPISQASGLACTGLGLALLLDRRSGVRLKAAALVLLAISIQVLWSRLMMLFFIGPIADFDAHAVGLLIQRPVVGNEVMFVDGSQKMSILAACTSVQNVSLALMLYVAIVRTVRPSPRIAELWALLGLFATVVVINLGRLVLMAQSAPMFEMMHGGVGWSLAEAAITVAVLAWALASVRREIF